MKTEKELKAELKALKKQFDAETDPAKRSAIAAEGERVAAELEALRTPPGPAGTAADPGPPVVNRALDPATVRVRAREPLAKIIEGEVRRFAKGDDFDCPADRVPALGPLVEPVQ